MCKIYVCVVTVYCQWWYYNLSIHFCCVIAVEEECWWVEDKCTVFVKQIDSQHFGGLAERNGESLDIASIESGRNVENNVSS